MTTIYLAFSRSGEAKQTFAEMQKAGETLNLLVSYVFLDMYRSFRHRMPKASRTILDSGAYSAWKSGKTIDINALIRETMNPFWSESICLDVIGDAEASMRNTLYMRSRGSPAYPVFHIGDPMDHLLEFKRLFPKVGLSCRFGEPDRESFAWLDRCFAAAWPHRFHSFGWVDERALNRFPFHSADTAMWNVNPSAFGKWKYCGAKLRVRGPKSLRAEVAWHVNLGRHLESLWRTTLAEIA